jgi:FkbH-like protein
MPRLTWLPQDLNWKSSLSQVPQGDRRWEKLQALANFDIDFVNTSLLDRRLMASPPEIGPKPLRLALLSSSTVDQLLPSLRIAALRRGVRLDVQVPDYGQYRQALLDPESPLWEFQPQVIVFAIDARSFIGNHFIADSNTADKHVESRVNDLTTLWRVARDRFGAQVIQQAFMPTFPQLMGNAEYRALGSPASMIQSANAKIRQSAKIENVDILALDDRVQRDGVGAWYNGALWNRAKQEISPIAAPMYGELTLRIVAARRGLSSKCLVLDLDNTLWGGVIGDDGVDGIVLGEGSAEGEAFLEFQRYAKALAQRGVIIAICSKNDEANALEAFERHPEMILRRTDIASFVANWDDKATNLRRIAAELNIGIEAIVFADDNPFERNIVRRELPQVKVPELPEDPALFSETIADAGYFEALEITPEDIARGASYQVTRDFRTGDIKTSDLEGYLSGLDMNLVWGEFDSLSLKRVVQLVNKTNQFNLTTRRYSEAEIKAIMQNPDAVGLHLRLVDRYADHGIICVLIAKRNSEDALEVESWLMSCRVLGRDVEKASLSVLIREARRRGFKTIVGKYFPTPKNGIVRDHYSHLGFDLVAGEIGSETVWVLDLARADVETPHIRIDEVTDGPKEDLRDAQ